MYRILPPATVLAALALALLSPVCAGDAPASQGLPFQFAQGFREQADPRVSPLEPIRVLAGRLQGREESAVSPRRRPASGRISTTIIHPTSPVHRVGRLKPNKHIQYANHGIWRSSATLVPFKNSEGVILLKATLRSVAGLDTTGILVLDTGAGYVALDAELANLIGIVAPQSSENPIGLADHPLPRLVVGGLEFDQVSPILTIDANIVRQVTDRPVLGLLGARPIASFAVVVDYLLSELGLISMPDPAENDTSGVDMTRHGHPSVGPRRIASERRADRIARIDASRAVLGDAIHKAAQPIAFRLRGDDKILVSVRVANSDATAASDTLTLIVDTGATKTALFTSELAKKAPRFEQWPSLRGLAAPTLIGEAEARIARVPLIEVLGDSASVPATQVDAALLDSPLAAALAAEVGEPVHGLLGYSFLRRFRLVIDYPHRVLWLESVRHPFDERPYEYTHVGIQLERRGAALSVVGIAAGSPAGRAGIERADEIIAIDGNPATKFDVIEASRRLEGRSGTVVVLRVRHGALERTVRLVRRRLL